MFSGKSISFISISTALFGRRRRRQRREGRAWAEGERENRLTTARTLSSAAVENVEGSCTGTGRL